jgi:hypothetical protein
MLVATAAGVPLYERLGFRTVETIEKLLCDRYQPPAETDRSADGMRDGRIPDGCLPRHLAASYRLRPLAADDVEAVIALDEAAVGARRNALLRARLTQAARSAVIRHADGSIAGFGLAVQRGSRLTIGPLVAPDAELALALIDYLAGEHQGTLRMDIPSGLHELSAGLVQRGFRQMEQPPVMMTGADRLPYNHTLFALASMAFG